MLTFPRILGVVTLLLFATIGLAAWLKNSENSKKYVASRVPIEVPLEHSTVTIAADVESDVATIGKDEIEFGYKTPLSADHLPNADRVEEFFNKGIPQFPVVETITYTSRVDWMSGRPAWLADYAAHYKTSRHFIARSLNGKLDYLTQNVTNGDQFNVFCQDKDFSFHLLVDASRCKMWFYYIDHDTNERVLVKRYNVALGRPESYKVSGLLTPLGKYSLGDKIATYKPGVMGYYLGNKIEMITVFGTRWIPFDQAISGCTMPAKGLGIHGAPWERTSTGELVPTDDNTFGYYSDGCIRLATPDMEELFAVIVTKPTVIEIVKDFNDARLPGTENPRR